MTKSEIQTASRIYDWGAFFCLIVFSSTLFIPNGLGYILYLGATAGMIGFMIAGILVARRLRQIALHDRGLPDHCLKCGQCLYGKTSGRCLACMKLITPGDVEGDPSRRPMAMGDGG